MISIKNGDRYADWVFGARALHFVLVCVVLKN